MYRKCEWELPWQPASAMWRIFSTSLQLVFSMTSASKQYLLKTSEGCATHGTFFGEHINFFEKEHQNSET